MVEIQMLRVLKAGQIRLPLVSARVCLPLEMPPDPASAIMDLLTDSIGLTPSIFEGTRQPLSGK